MAEYDSHTIIIGGDAAGLKAAARLRRLQPNARITVLERGTTISYAACGFPYYLSGDIDDFEELTRTAWGEAKTPEYFKRNKDIDVITEMEAVEIDPKARVVTARASDGGQRREFSYDNLVIATGATPACPNVPGIPCDGVSAFTRPEDVRDLREAMQRNEIGRVAVIGGGYIGLELAEAFAALWGADVLLVEQESHVMPANLDPEMSALIEKHLREQDIDVRTDTRVTRIQCREENLEICINGSTEETVDRVIHACGVVPNSRLAKDAGLKIGDQGGILIDANGRTSDSHIYAAGDCAELPNDGNPRILPLGSIANRMGRIVANSIAGIDDPGLPRVHGSGVVKVFDLNVASVGISASRARSSGLKVEEYWGTFEERAHYYPETKEVRIKVVKEAGGNLLGMQAVGEGEVVRWVDAFALILELADGDPLALQRFEHAYAPPYATAMDPLHHFAAMIEAGPGYQIPPDSLQEGGKQNWTWINLLEPEERKGVELPPVRGKIIEMTMAELRQRIDELPKQNVVCFCAKGPRSYEAARLLRQNDIHAKYLAGGVLFAL